jgi:predicted membrane protein (TIGR00267 family)
MWNLHRLIRISNSEGIARRFFVTNGFDGALTMIGLFMGFYLGQQVPVEIAIKACLGAAIALLVSGSTSAYISEAAERKREIQELEAAMAKDLDASLHGRAARVIPWFVAMVNGLSPLTICLLVMTPLWLEVTNHPLPGNVFIWCLSLSLVVIFILGLYLSRISGQHWLVSGCKALLIAGVTVSIIFVLDGL